MFVVSPIALDPAAPEEPNVPILRFSNGSRLLQKHSAPLGQQPLPLAGLQTFGSAGAEVGGDRRAGNEMIHCNVETRVTNCVGA